MKLSYWFLLGLGGLGLNAHAACPGEHSGNISFISPAAQQAHNQVDTGANNCAPGRRDTEPVIDELLAACRAQNNAVNCEPERAKMVAPSAIPSASQDATTTPSNKLGAWLFLIENTGLTHAQLADRLKVIGIKRIFIKIADGSTNCVWFPDACSSVTTDIYKSRGIEPWAWSYNYPGNVTTQAAALTLAAQYGYLGFVLDIEKEFDGLVKPLDDLMKAFSTARAAARTNGLIKGNWYLTATTWGNPKDHAMRVDIIDQYVDAHMPQTYLEIWGASYLAQTKKWIEVGNCEYRALGAKKPIWHIASGEKATTSATKQNEFFKIAGPNASIWVVPGGPVPMSEWNTWSAMDWQQTTWDSTTCSVGNYSLSGLPPPLPDPAKAQSILLRVNDGQLLSASLINNQFQLTPKSDPGANFRIVAAVDLDGNGPADLVFQDLTQGGLDTPADVRVWRDLDPINSMLLRQVKPAWKVEAAGDLDGDGFGDLVWRYGVAGSPDTGVSYIWFTDGTAVTKVRKRGGAPLDWTLLGTADLNGDKAADMIYISPTNQVRVLMATAARTCANLGAGIIPAGFKALKIADFTGNGRGDILLRHTDTGETRLMALDARGLSLPAPTADPEDRNASCTGSTLVVNTAITPLAMTDPTWNFFAAVDLDGDGIVDIVWQQPNGMLIVWLSAVGGATPTAVVTSAQPGGSVVLQP